MFTRSAGEPRKRGNSIFESDVVVRQAMCNKGADHVGLVLLHWSESDPAEGAEQVLDDDNSAREVRQDLSLQFYAIAGPNRRIDFSTIDSRSSRFPDEPPALIRDPNSGEMLPIPREELVRILDGSDVTEKQVLDADGNGNTSDEGAATVYLRPTPQFWANPTDLVSSVIRVRQRQFRTVFLSDLHCRTFEIRGGQIVSVATIDLRAWQGASELLYYVHWQAEDFLVEFLMPDEVTTLRAASCRIRNLPDWPRTGDANA